MDRNRGPVPGNWSLVREKMLTTGLCLEAMANVPNINFKLGSQWPPLKKSKGLNWGSQH